ncbi:MAG: response regulator [Candidatus Rokubacteria bacterium]|nr:response regulator [Candidatus Rokubacteria bacterium]
MALEAGVTVRRLQELVARHPQGASGPVSLNDVVAEALEVTQPRWRDESERRGVRITVAQDLAPVSAVEGNHADLRQALVHLILNAVEAMPSGGALTLSSRSVEPGWVELEVADTGADRSDGLSEAQALVLQHGGHLSMERAPAGGAVVRVRLPESRFHLIPSRREVEPCAPEQARNILVADDDPRPLRALADLLEGSGHAVVTAASGAEGLARFEAEAADLVITDLGMPGMTGWELAERIKARSPGTPVFLLTGWGEAVADADASRRPRRQSFSCGRAPPSRWRCT